MEGDAGFELYDAHCHLQDPRFGGHLNEVIAAAHAAGVRHFNVQSTCEDDWDKVRALTDARSDMRPNFGLHPWFVSERSQQWLQRLRAALKAVPSAGLGECGLDKAHRDSGMATQEAVFRQQLQLGQELRRPISVHCVRAYGKLLGILQELGPFPAGLVLHAWAGPEEMVAPLAKIGGVRFSISGHVVRLPLPKAAAMLKQIPLDRLLLETDSPDGLPQISDTQLARMVEAAAGGGLRLLPLEPDQASSDDAHSSTAADSRQGGGSGCHGRDPRSSSGSGADRKCSSDSNDGGSCGAGDCSRPWGEQDCGTGGAAHDAGTDVGSTQQQPGGCGTGYDAGSSHGAGEPIGGDAGVFATIPLDWNCPLEVAAPGGFSLQVEHPRQLLNQPANVRVVLHLVAQLTSCDAAELAATSVRNAKRLFGVQRGN